MRINLNRGTAAFAIVEPGAETVTAPMLCGTTTEAFALAKKFEEVFQKKPEVVEVVIFCGKRRTLGSEQ